MFVARSWHLRLVKEFCCFVTTAKPLLSGHRTELTIVVLDYVLEIRNVVDKSIHLDVNKLYIRPISGRMIVIYDQSSPKSLDQSKALLHGTLSQYRVTIEC